MSTTPEWISIISPFLSGAIGIAAGWGITRQKVIDLERRMLRTEEKLDEQVGQLRCDRMREECRDNLMKIMCEIKKEVVDNRGYVMDKFTEIARFMGAHNGGYPKSEH